MPSEKDPGLDPLQVFTGTKPPPKEEREIPGKIPILGLTDIVILPGVEADLKIDSAEGIQLIEDAVSESSPVGLVFQRNDKVLKPYPEDLHGFGCLASIEKLGQTSEKEMTISIRGLERIRIGRYASTSPYLVAEIEVVETEAESSPELTARIEMARKEFKKVIAVADKVLESQRLAVYNQEDPGRMADLIAGLLHYSKLNERQEILEAHRLDRRLELLYPLLQREADVLSATSRIVQQVDVGAKTEQRNYYLRKQMEAILEEIGEQDPVSAVIGELGRKVEENGLSEEAARVCRKELERLKYISSSLAEYQITRDYVEYLADLPWKASDSRRSLAGLDIGRARRILDEHHFGMHRVKERVVDALASMKIRLSREDRGGREPVKSTILCLTGPPGVGKTSLGNSIAAILGRKFASISLGGMKDEAEIRGHRRTYVGARPGRIVQTLARAGSNDPVILLDEIDKISSDSRGDPASALLEVLDPQQNRSFVDNYVDVPFDLSQVFFIATANWLDHVAAALRDRMEVIELSSYTLEEKQSIAERHLIPRQRAYHCLEGCPVQLGSASVRHIISGYTREAGVRELDRQIDTVLRKASIQSLGQDPPRTVRISKKWIRTHLGPQKYHHDPVEPIEDCGIAVGLGWTPLGGQILYIEAIRIPGSGKLLLTGSMGEVMKESAHAAYTFVRSQAPALGVSHREFERHDTHLHVPAGGIQKDGASAGVAIAAALASLFTQRGLRPGLSMTGEVTLRGRVERVGGIREKALAALRSGIRTLILPRQNQSDLESIPREARSELEVHLVHRVSEVFELSLLP